MTERVLVTGAGGFIGSHLAEHLCREGGQVRALVHYNSRGDWGALELAPDEIKGEIEVVAGDVRDYGALRAAVKGCRVVFHLAALIAIPYSYRAPQSYVETNVGGTLNVLQACLEEGVERLVHTSTSEVYGTARRVPMDEEHPLQGQSPYSASKIGADKLAESFHLSYGLPVATLRPFNTFGPRQSARAVISTIISQLLAGCRELRLGSLDPVRDLTFVEDTARAFALTAGAEGAVGRVVNAGRGEGVSIGELARLIMRLAGREVPIVCEAERVRPENSEVLRLVCDRTLAGELLGWRPEVSLEEGLRRTMEFIERHGDWYKADTYAL